MSLIKCPECGAEVSDKADKCIKCGCPVTFKKNYKINIKKIAVVPIGIVAILALVLFITLRRDSVVEGKYYMVFVDDKTSYKEFIPTDSDKTEGQYIDYPWDMGYEHWYYIKNGVVYADSILGITEYDIWGDYLVPTKYSYVGEIPSGKTFDVVCFYEKDSIIFKQDGTIVYGKKRGTYTRESEIIEVYYPDTDEHYNYLIYKGKINNSAYKKADK